jgi:hypothetical protein
MAVCFTEAGLFVAGSGSRICSSMMQMGKAVEVKRGGERRK